MMSISSGLTQLIVGFLFVFVVIMVILYVYFSLALMAIAKKTKAENAWLAWIPVANIYLMTQMAGLPGWYTFSILLGIIPFVGGLAFLAVLVYIWWKIAEKLNKPGWWGILMAIPFVNLVIVGIMAWGN